MTEKRPEELHETEKRAHAYLQDATAIPSAPALGRCGLRLRLWHYPAFDALRTWSVFEKLRRGEPSTFLVRQITWDRPYDYQRLHDPLMGLQEGLHSHPKIESRDRSLDTTELAFRLAK